MTVRQRGDAWQAIVIKKKAGKIIHQESRTFTDPDIRRAERLARDWEVRAKARIALDGVPQRLLSATTLGELLRKYRTTVSGIKPMRRAMEHEIEQLATEFDNVRLGSLDAAVFTKWSIKRHTGGAGPVTILHNLATVRSVLNTAKPMFGLDIDGRAVAEAITALNRLGVTAKSNVRTRRPTEEELARLDADFKRMAGHPSNIIQMDKVVKVALGLPRRLGELTRMRWIDYSDGLVTLHDTKNPTKPRTEIVPVPASGQAAIADMPVVDERILPYNSESVSAAFQRACDRLGIEDLHFHDLRHEGISRLFEAGFTIPEVSMVSGHLSWNMLRRYTNLQPKTVMEKMNAK